MVIFLGKNHHQPTVIYPRTIGLWVVRLCFCLRLLFVCKSESFIKHVIDIFPLSFFGFLDFILMYPFLDRLVSFEYLKYQWKLNNSFHQGDFSVCLYTFNFFSWVKILRVFVLWKMRVMEWKDFLQKFFSSNLVLFISLKKLFRGENSPIRARRYFGTLSWR